MNKQEVELTYLLMTLLGIEPLPVYEDIEEE